MSANVYPHMYCIYRVHLLTLVVTDKQCKAQVTSQAVYLPISSTFCGCLEHTGHEDELQGSGLCYSSGLRMNNRLTFLYFFTKGIWVTESIVPVVNPGQLQLLQTFQSQQKSECPILKMQVFSG